MQLTYIRRNEATKFLPIETNSNYYNGKSLFLEAIVLIVYEISPIVNNITNFRTLYVALMNNLVIFRANRDLYGTILNFCFSLVTCGILIGEMVLKENNQAL